MKQPPTLKERFLQDAQGRRYTDVLNNPDMPTDFMFKFFDDTEKKRRMVESEEHHGRPALAGVIKEFEASSQISKCFSSHTPSQTLRFRQTVGVIVRIIMVDELGWEKTGDKGTVPAKWWSRSEHYVKSATSASLISARP